MQRGALDVTLAAMRAFAFGVVGLVGLGLASPAHADSNEILRWLGGFTQPPRLTFIVHGEPPAMEALSGAIHAKLGWNTKMPSHGETVELA